MFFLKISFTTAVFRLKSLIDNIDPSVYVQVKPDTKKRIEARQSAGNRRLEINLLLQKIDREYSLA